MSTWNPYIRDRLDATRMGLTDPALLVDLWFDRYLELLETSGDLPEPEAYEIVALFARINRCAPELLAGHSGDLARTDLRLVEWLPLALSIPDPDGWLREAADLAAACDEAAPDAELTEWAEQLLTDLDDADLVAWAARRQGLLSDALEQGLIRCADWLGENPDRFFPAGVFIQGVGRTIRPDLPVFDLDLAGTADKYVVLLDALEEVQERFGSSKPVIRPSADDWADFPEAGLALAAATPESVGLFRRRWSSPGGEFTALLVVGPDAPDAPPARINFRAGNAAAAELAGHPVWLANCPGRIDANGNADFPRAALEAARRAGHSLTLRVGHERQPWNRSVEGP